MLKTLCIAAALLPGVTTQETAKNSSSISLTDALVNYGILPLIGQTLYVSSATATYWRDLIHAYQPEFCDSSKTVVPPLKTISDPDVQAEDHEQLIPLIKKYVPVLYMHKDEIYFPIRITEWCYGEKTAIIAHNGTVIVPPGKITNEFLASCMDRPPITPERLAECETFYFDNPSCSNYGSDPRLNTNEQNALTTPCYVVTSQTATHTYLQYAFIYGFNGPYPIGPFEGDIIPLQDAHEFDLEHITLELNNTDKTLSRIFYSSHATYEGFWLDAQHPDVEYEDGHPVVYIARGSHGNYNKAGTYVRIFGAANDITSHTIRWTPEIVRTYNPDDPRYNASFVWCSFGGGMGKRGVVPLCDKYWYRSSLDWDIGQRYETVLFCPEQQERGTVIQKMAASFSKAGCIVSKIPLAQIPSVAQAP